MRVVDILQRKRDGLELSAAQIDAFVDGATHGTWPDYQLSALLMAISWRGMSDAETIALTRAMADSGARLDWSGLEGPRVDKHSTGGVGDKTTMIVAPLAAACGLFVPKMSGRGLGHSGGTVDKLESIPGFRVDLSLEEFRAAVSAVGCALVGQSKRIAPADKKLYALRDVTATVASIPLIAASILSKKIPESIDALVLDVKCGRGAFMKTRDDALALGRLLVEVGNRSGLATVALLTDMDAPLGRAVGNALEVKECIEALRGEGPVDVTNLAITLAARMLILGGMVEFAGQAEARVREAIVTGRGLEKLGQIVARQGGDPRVVDDPSLLPRAREQISLPAPRSGFVSGIDAEKVGRACMLLGAGRQRVEDRIDPAVGVVLQAHVGDEVQQGEALAVVHVNDPAHREQAVQMLQTAWEIGAERPLAKPLVLETLGGAETAAL